MLSIPLVFAVAGGATPPPTLLLSGGEKYEESLRVPYFAGLCAAVFLSSPPAQSRPKRASFRKNANKIENNYIVVLDDDVVGERGRFSIAPYVASEIDRATHQGKLKHVYQHALNGFAVEMSPEDAERLSQDFRVKYVEEDGVVTADATQSQSTLGS